MDYEYDSDEPYESRVLWGRVGVYAASLLLMFMLGSCVGGRGGIDEAQVEALDAEVTALREANRDLEAQIAAMGNTGDAERPRISEGEEEGEGDGEDVATEGEAGSGETRTYEVQSGDTLTSIAQRMYGDSTKFSLIADANDLDGQLVVGQELIIPPAE
jgi:nucleoid-associated protein YgaU